MSESEKIYRFEKVCFLEKEKKILDVLSTETRPDTVVLQLNLKAIEFSFCFAESQNLSLILILVSSQYMHTMASQVGDSRLEMVFGDDSRRN